LPELAENPTFVEMRALRAEFILDQSVYVLECSKPMSEEMGVRWWNRAVPVNTPAFMMIGIVLSASLVAGLIYLYVGPVLQACLWDIGHHSTATYQRLSVRVPRLWRQEETPAGQRQLRLVRARWGEPVEFESIVIGEDKGTSQGLQNVTERLQALAGKLGREDFQGVPMSLDPRFSCMAPHFTKVQSWQVSCLSTDNHWSANLYGPTADINSFKLVLQSMAWR
jgi:hypothetical protein